MCGQYRPRYRLDGSAARAENQDRSWLERTPSFQYRCQEKVRPDYRGLAGRDWALLWPRTVLPVPLKDQQPRLENKRLIDQLPIKARSGKNFWSDRIGLKRCNRLCLFASNALILTSQSASIFLVRFFATPPFFIGPALTAIAQP